jgi:hypothetical protein
MTNLFIKRLPCDLSSHAGLTFISKYFKCINVNVQINPAFAVSSGIVNSDLFKSQLVLLCLCKNDFDVMKRFSG